MSPPAHPSETGQSKGQGRAFSTKDSLPALDSSQLDNIKTQLDLVLLALEAIAGLGSEAMLQAARELGVEDMVSDRVSLWRLRQSNPMRKGSGGRKKLDVEEARSLVLVSCHLAQTHHRKIRQAVELLERVTAAEQPPHHTPILGDYLDRFTNIYEDRMEDDHISTEGMTQLAFKLLIDLLFYGGTQGSQRLWMLLLDCSRLSALKNFSKSAAKPSSANAPSETNPSTKLKRATPPFDESIG
jgi:hypothetical protein